MSKLIIIFFALFTISAIKPSAYQGKVYVCLSGSAYAYHKNMECRGMRACTHPVKEVTLRYATDTLKRKPCGYCY